MEEMTPAQAAVYDALSAACTGTDLTAHTDRDLTGAWVRGVAVEAYVISVPTGYQVDLWRASGSNPFKIKIWHELDQAVTFALAAAQSRRTTGGSETQDA